ncbi:hypothetical protein RFI_23623, partial [Reticulomyxa filosa]
ILSVDAVDNDSKNETNDNNEKSTSDKTNNRNGAEDSDDENDSQSSSIRAEKDRFLKNIRRKTKDFPLRLHALSGLKSGDALQSLYDNFLQSQNFILWYAPKHARAERWHKRVVETKDVVFFFGKKLICFIFKRIKEMCMACLIKGKPISEGKLMYFKIQKLLTKNNSQTKVDHSLNRAMVSHLRILEKCGVRICKEDDALTAHEWYRKVIKPAEKEKASTSPQKSRKEKSHSQADQSHSHAHPHSHSHAHSHTHSHGHSLAKNSQSTKPASTTNKGGDGKVESK